MATSAHEVREPSAACLKLRDDLVITPRTFGDVDCYVIEDPLRGKFFRVGQPEYALISLLDGRTTIAAALGQAAGTLGASALTEQEALAVCRWLVDSNLASTPDSSTTSRLSGTAERQQSRKLFEMFNPLAMRLPLGNPDRWLARVLPKFSWLLGLPALIVGLVIIATGVVLTTARWDEFCSGGEVLFDPANWLRMFVVWLAIKIVHESAHGLVCKKYGGEVTRAGVMFLLLAPVAFVCVTSSWRFRSKWQRIAVAAAGMYVELVLAALAVIAWYCTEDGLAHRLCFQIAVLCSLTTLAVNANPLMRFDGYFILADLCEIPNLYACGQQYLRYWLQRYLLGMDVAQPNWSGKRAAIIQVYAIAALAWRMLLYFSLTIVLAGLWGTLGGILAMLLGGIWFGVPAYRSIRQLVQRRGLTQVRPKQFIMSAAVASMLVAVLIVLGSRPARVTASAIVEYDPLTVIRADGPGFVRQVFVSDGQIVHAGDTIAVLENDEIRQRLGDLNLEIEQTAIRARLRKRESGTAKQQVEVSQRESLERKRTELQSQVDSLTVRAPATGRIVSRELSTLVGRYLPAGTPVALLAGEDTKQLLLAIAQNDISSFQDGQLDLLDVRLVGTGEQLTAKLKEVEPRASAEPAHPALGSQAGGPLLVRLKPPKPDSTKAATYELLAPHFTGHVSLSAEQSRSLLAGQLAEVCLTCPSESAFSYLLRRITSNIQQRLDSVRQQQN